RQVHAAGRHQLPADPAAHPAVQRRRLRRRPGPLEVPPHRGQLCARRLAMHYDQATGEFSQEVLRHKTTLSVLTLRYSDGLGGTVQLSRLLLLHAGHSSDSDVKSLYVIARKPMDVADLRPFVSTQIEGKAL